jgi:hypothetical protein
LRLLAAREVGVLETPEVPFPDNLPLIASLEGPPVTLYPSRGSMSLSVSNVRLYGEEVIFEEE